MTVYQVSGNIREQLGTEQAAEVATIDTAALATVIANMDAIRKVADSLGSFASLDQIVATAQAAATTAQAAQLNAEAAENNAAVSASGIDAKVQLADDWARKMDAPVSGTDVSSKQSAVNAAGSAADADGSSAAAGTSEANAAASASTADQIANGPSGVEVTPGHFTMATYVDQILGIISQAPVIGGRFINNAGIAGEETINFAATDFYRTVEVQRAVGHDVKLKCLQGLYTGPVPQGMDRSYAWIQVINSGAGNIHVEGPQPAGGGTVTTVFPPKRIAYAENDFKVNTPGSSSPTVSVLPAIAVPVGTGRIVTVITLSTYWSGTGHSTSIASSNIVGLTKQQSAGDGTIGNANPILIETFTGTLADGTGGTAGPSYADLGVTFTMSAFAARGVVLVFVHQDCSGFENPFAALRTGNALTVTRTITPSAAQCVNVLCAGFRQAAAAPVNFTVTPSTTDAEDFTANGIGQPGNNNTDISYGLMNDAGLLGVAYAYTATAAVANPAVIGGITLKPRTVTTTVAGDDGLVTDQTKPFLIAPKQQGFILAASDGSTWYGDK